MLKEHGVVLKDLGSRVQVATTRSSACHGCSSKSGSCACGSMTADPNAVVHALNDADASPNDIVEISLPEGAFLWASVATYLLPVLLLVAGAVVGHSTRSTLGLSSDAASGLGALLGMAVGLFGTWLASRQAARTGLTVPHVTKVLVRKKGAPSLETEPPRDNPA